MSFYRRLPDSRVQPSSMVSGNTERAEWHRGFAAAPGVYPLNKQAVRIKAFSPHLVLTGCRRTGNPFEIAPAAQKIS
jgi:hypothetical protein